MHGQDNCTITPVVSDSSANFIEGLVKDAESHGAKLMQQYKRQGNLIWPVLIDHVTAVRTLLCVLSTTPRLVPVDALHGSRLGASMGQGRI